VRALLRGDGGVAGDVEENEEEGGVVRDEAEQDHRVPPQGPALVEHPEHAPSCGQEVL